MRVGNYICSDIAASASQISYAGAAKRRKLYNASGPVARSVAECVAAGVSSVWCFSMFCYVHLL